MGSEQERGEIIKNGAVDYVGHGTGVAFLISHVAKETTIIPIKVMNDMMCTIDVLIGALEYVLENVECDIVHVSLGVTCCDKIEELREICRKIDEKGVVIVSALDNRGMVSYPAAFDCVIGVDSSLVWHKTSDYTMVKYGEMDIVGYRAEQRVQWLNGSTQMVCGTSFTAAYFTGKIAKIIQRDVTMNRQRVLAALAKDAKREICVSDIKLDSIGFSMNKAVAFPYNKEMHSLVRFSDMLIVNDIEFYDSKYHGQVGKSLREWSWGEQHSNEVIKNIDKLDWESDFDTFILGHIHALEELTGKNCTAEIVKKCIYYSKQLISFDCLTSCVNQDDLKKINYYYPQIPPLHEKTASLKTHYLGVPVLCINGTRSQQGKYTVQLALRKAFNEAGYRVGGLGTEPSSLLFGLDAVYPMGYAGNVQVKGSDAVYTVNRLLGAIQRKQPDIIITGTQGGAHLLYPGGYFSTTIANHEFLLGCQADAHLLCISYDDEIDDIAGEIKYLESIYSSKVIALVLSPYMSNSKWSILSTRSGLVDDALLEEYRRRTEVTLGKSVFTVRSMQDARMLMEQCIDFFS